MARRAPSNMDMVVEILHAPWWFSLPFIGLAYATFAWIVPWIMTPGTDANEIAKMTSPVFANVSRSLAPMIGIGLLILWGIIQLVILGKSQTRRSPASERGTQRIHPALATTPIETTSTPSCPSCGSSMKIRTNRRGKNPGSQFWGCKNYPTCRQTIDIFEIV